MDFVLVFPLILAFLSTGQSYTEATEQTSDSCYSSCLPGYYKVGDCGNGQNKCAKCGKGTFTDIKNNITNCLRCDSCGHDVEVKPCSFNSNVVCDCAKGKYNRGSQHNLVCYKCPTNEKKPDNNPDYEKKCILSTTTEKLRSTATTIPPNPSTTTTTKIVTSTSTPTAARTTPSNSMRNQMPWLFLMGVMVTLLVLLWLLLFKFPDSCHRWIVNKDLEPSVEDPKFNEQRRHQDSSQTILTFNISEETPMMTLSQSPATPEHAGHVNLALPDTEHKAARQDEQSEHWPAIVLYAIIKEVPLRRWKEFLRLLSVADQQLERVELEAGLGLGSMERQYQMLRLWSQRSSSSLNDVFSALHYMDLSGCAQLLQDSLEKLQWRPEQKHGFTACRSYTDHGFNGAMQDT